MKNKLLVSVEPGRGNTKIVTFTIVDPRNGGINDDCISLIDMTCRKQAENIVLEIAKLLKKKGK